VSWRDQNELRPGNKFDVSPISGAGCRSSCRLCGRGLAGETCWRSAEPPARIGFQLPIFDGQGMSDSDSFTFSARYEIRDPHADLSRFAVPPNSQDSGKVLTLCPMMGRIGFHLTT